MNPPPESPRKPRPSAKPLLSSSALPTFVWIALACVLVVMMGLFALRSASRRGPPDTADSRGGAPTAGAPAAPVPPTPKTPSPEELAARDVRIHTLFEGSLADTKNDTDFAETPGYRHLLEILARYPDEEIHRLADRQLDRPAVLADPDGWRGAFVHLRGIVALRYAVRLRQPVAGREDVYQVILTDPEGYEAVVVDLLDEPPPIAIRKDPVDLEGIFYRTVRYESSAARDPIRTVPYLVAKTLKPVERPRREALGFLRHPGATALVGMALALMAARLLIYAIQRRSRPREHSSGAEPAGFRRMFENRLGRGGPKQGPRPES